MGVSAVTTQGIVNVPANSVVGNNTGSAGCAVPLTAAQLAAMFGASGALPTTDPGTAGAAFITTISGSKVLAFSAGTSTSVTADTTSFTADTTAITADRA